MHKRATRINKAIRCRKASEWFTTEDIDLDAHIFGKATQTSAIISEMKRAGLLEAKRNPNNKRASLYKKLKGANAFLDQRISKAKPASFSELIAEQHLNLDMLSKKQEAA